MFGLERDHASWGREGSITWQCVGALATRKKRARSELGERPRYSNPAEELLLDQVSAYIHDAPCPDQLPRRAANVYS